MLIVESVVKSDSTWQEMLGWLFKKIGLTCNLKRKELSWYTSWVPDNQPARWDNITDKKTLCIKREGSSSMLAMPMLCCSREAHWGVILHDSANQAQLDLRWRFLQNSPKKSFKDNITLRKLWTLLYHKEAHYCDCPLTSCIAVFPGG